MKIVTFKASKDLVEKLEDLAQMKGKTRSDIIREAIEVYYKLESYKVTPSPKIVRLTS